jgi:D-alanyl-D-alanine carboxypeptidase
MYERFIVGIRKLAVAAVACAFFAAGSASAARLASIVIDANTGKVMQSNDAGGIRYPASLTKMMTLYLVFQALESGKITKSTQIPMSKRASNEPPSKLGVKPGESFAVEDGILALVTRSANDVAWAFAEYLGGDVNNFGRMMTAQARSLGMNSTVYVNPNGLPDPRQITTAHDQALLGIALRQHFPEYYGYFSTRSFRFGRQVIGNHNHLLGKVAAIDGIKTGYTRAAGFNLATSAQADGHSVVVVVLGGKSTSSRDALVTELVKRYLPASSSGRKTYVIAKTEKKPTFTIAPSIARNVSNPTKNSIEVADAGNKPILTDNSASPEQHYATQRIGMAFGNSEPAATDQTATQTTAPQPPVIVKEDDDSEQPMPQQVASAAPTSAYVAPEAPVEPSRKAPARVDKVTTASTSSDDDSDSADQPSKGWIIQIGTSDSAAQAKELLHHAQAKGGKVLRSAKPFTVAFTSDGSKLYRARFGGFDDQDAAVKACKVLKRQRVSCWASQK